mgnify:CR=1 FL=1
MSSVNGRLAAPAVAGRLRSSSPWSTRIVMVPVGGGGGGSASDTGRLLGTEGSARARGVDR